MPNADDHQGEFDERPLEIVEDEMSEEKTFAGELRRMLRRRRESALHHDKSAANWAVGHLLLHHAEEILALVEAAQRCTALEGYDNPSNLGKALDALDRKTRQEG